MMTSPVHAQTTARTAAIEAPRPSAVECAGTRSASTTRRIASNLLSVTNNGTVVGFVEKADNIFVTLAGVHYDRAVEVGQSFDLAVAVALLDPSA